MPHLLIDEKIKRAKSKSKQRIEKYKNELRSISHQHVPLWPVDMPVDVGKVEVANPCLFLYMDVVCKN